MAITVAANGLSIVHKSSGGEANATLPDVCLTTIGPAVVLIPYGNNAKSADLNKGTTTITMDGGNPVAIKDSTFTKSTGDAGGDKKGLVSGTIEAEAAFISASPTVKFEGQGVCRLSDQMTMNKANTLCLGGAQNPSVSLSPEEEGTYTVDIACRYPDGKPFKNAQFKIFDDQENEIATGQLNEQGRATVPDLPPGDCKVVYDEDPSPYEAKQIRTANLNKTTMLDDDFFEKCAKDSLPFWQERSVNTQRDAWGIFNQALATDKQFINLLALEFRAHFQLQISENEAQQLAISLATLFDDTSGDPQLMEHYLFQLAPIISPSGNVVQLLYNVHKDEHLDNVLALLRDKGHGDANTYLKDVDWEQTKQVFINESDTVIEKLNKRLEAIEAHASRSHYAVITESVKQHREKITHTKRKIPDTVADAITSLSAKSETIQGKNTFIKVVTQFNTGSTTQLGKVIDVVHTQANMPKPLDVRLCYDDQENTPVSNIPYKATYSSGKVFEGRLDGQGKSRVRGVPQNESLTLQFGDPDAAAQAQSDRAGQLDLLGKEIKQYAQFLATETIKNNAKQPAPNAELFEKIKSNVNANLLEYEEKKAELNNAYWVERWWEISKSAAEGIKDGVVNYMPDFGEIGDVFDALDMDISLLITALVTGNIDELEEALKHVDRSQLHLQEASESMERLLLIISDPDIREYLMTLPILYAEALPADEAAKYGASFIAQKGIDASIVVAGTGLGTAAGGVGGPAMAVLLTSAATVRTGGKAIEPVIKALEPLIKGRKNSKNDHKVKPNKDETNLERGKCKLCGKKLPKAASSSTKKKKKNTSSNADGEYCTAPKGYQGKLYKEGDIGYGFTKRGAIGENATSEQRQHYPWKFLPYKSQYAHPWYRLVYDMKSNRYTRPKHIKEKKNYQNPKAILAAHHLITVKEMKTNTFLFELLPQLGYDLNQTHNITVLPVLPELGCELGVQIHNSNHPKPYTEHVAAQLKKLEARIKKSKACISQKNELSIHEQMEEISIEMLNLMNENDNKKRPTKGVISQPAKWGDDYLVGNKGCRNKRTESKKTPLSRQCSHRLNGTHHALRDISGNPLPLPSVHRTEIGQ